MRSRRPAAVLWLECASLIGVVAAISTVGRAGITWACLCVGGVFVLRTLAAMWVVSRKDGVADLRVPPADGEAPRSLRSRWPPA